MLRDVYSWDRSRSVTRGCEKIVAAPDQAWSLHELLQRHTEGLLTDVQQRKPIYYDSDHDSEDVTKVIMSDLYQREMFMQQTEERVAAIREAKKKAEAMSQTAKVAEPREERHVRDGAAAAGKDSASD